MGKRPPKDKVEAEVQLRFFKKQEAEKEARIAAAKAAGTYKEEDKPPIDHEIKLAVQVFV